MLRQQKWNFSVKVKLGASLLALLALRLLSLARGKEENITLSPVMWTARPWRGTFPLKKDLLRPLFKVISVDVKSAEDPRNFTKVPGVIIWIQGGT